MRLLPMLALFCGAAFAQNTDLGLLIGISRPVSEFITGSSGGYINSSVGAHGQINFAFQLKEQKAGRLYLEFPLLLGGHARATVGPGVSASSGATVFFTPGLRWNFPIHSRVSLYGAAGGGLAGAHRDFVFVTGTQLSTREQYLFGLAGSIGGGVDLRLSRLMSLRGEVRDFISGRGFNGTNGHNHVIYGFGVGFHW